MAGGQGKKALAADAPGPSFASIRGLQGGLPDRGNSRPGQDIAGGSWLRPFGKTGYRRNRLLDKNRYPGRLFCVCSSHREGHAPADVSDSATPVGLAGVPPRAALRLRITTEYPTRLMIQRHGDGSFREVLVRLRWKKCGALPAPVYLCSGHRTHCMGGAPDWAVELVPPPKE
jgi:hypothetical protein